MDLRPARRAYPPSPTGQFIAFDQSAFDKGAPDGLAQEGVVYVPPDCASHPGCRLHIALHGCDQARETVGDAFIKESGFARYADTNRLVDPVSPSDREPGQPAWLLGLVGL